MMISRSRCRWFACLVGSIVLALPGCRDTEPTPSHYRDLGDGGRILLPGGSPWYEVRTERRSSAEWVPFREPDFEAVAEGTETPRGPATSGTGAPAARGAERIEAEIRDLIDEYNEIAAEGDFEELLEYHVEAQQDAIKAMFDAAVAMMEKLEALRAAFKEKLPDEAQRIDAVVDLLTRSAGSIDLVIDSLTVVSNTEVMGKPPAGSPQPTCRFKLVDDEWYVETPDLPDFSQLKPQIDMLLATFDGWIQGVESGQLPAAALLQQVEAQAKVIGAAQGQGEQEAGGQEAETEDNTAGNDGG